VIKRHHTARRASPPSHVGPPLSRLIDRIWDEHGVKAWPELRRNRCTSGASHASPGRVDVTVDSCTPPVPTDLAQHGELLLVQAGGADLAPRCGSGPIAAFVVVPGSTDTDSVA
jgi:hypothetical protein